MTPLQNTQTGQIHANGIDIHYREAGSGNPLVLLHGGVVSTNPIWNDHPFAFAGHTEALAKHFRVIAPDTRGAGLTVHPTGAASFAVLADDVIALIEALDLDQPMVYGFSEGGTTATVVAIRRPELVSALVNQAGYDLFNPRAPSFMMMRQMLGGAPDAVQVDPAAIERFFESSDETRITFEMLKADHDGAQGSGYWRTYLANAFDRTTRSPGWTFDDLADITAPSLILVGDRDHFCSVEEAVTSFRRLPNGELAVLPNHEHVISPASIETAIDFLLRTR
jgi:pimeloyl-ACP methyl ester carboxylesterase